MTLSNEFTRKPQPEIRSYKQANEYLGKKDSRPLRYKTRVERRSPTTIAIKHHNTDIITYVWGGYEKEGSVIIDTQGWHTVTTKDRLNNYLPGKYPRNGFRVYQEDSIWYLSKGDRFNYDPETARCTKNPDFESVVFKDGMSILPDGTIEGAGPPIEELKKLNKEILKYSREYIKALFAGEVGKPGPRDCWFCMFVPEPFIVQASIDEEDVGEPLQQTRNPTNHLISHFEEKYYVPSLLVRAIEVFPVSKAAVWALSDLWGEGPEVGQFFYGVAKQQLRSALRRYLRRQLGLAS